MTNNLPGKTINLLKNIYFIIFLNIYSTLLSDNDLTVIGSLNYSGSLARLPISFIDMLKYELKMGFIPTNNCVLKDLPIQIHDIILNQKFSASKVIFFTDILWHNNMKKNIYKYFPKSSIKISYSMFESTEIPKTWVEILNKNFDLVVVPDEFLIEIYKNSGVNIPIFCLPIAIFIDELLKFPEKKVCNKPFIFGCSSVAWNRKNLSLLIKSFLATFGNNDKNIKLVIHTKSNLGLNDLKKIINESNAKNIQLIADNLPWIDYVKLLSSFDSYVLLSKGEGFSISVREALAVGIPCIISNNTGHKTICDTNLVYSIDSKIEEPAYYEFFNDFYGKQFNCKIEDVIEGLQKVYKNYQYYLQKAQAGRIWVQKYCHVNLKDKYLNLFKPKKIILGSENLISSDYLMTNSINLYNKYLEIV